MMTNDEDLRQDIIQQVKMLPDAQLRDVLQFVKSRNDTARSPRSIEEKIEERLADVPQEALDELPADGSENVDHYVYGGPKK